MAGDIFVALIVALVFYKPVLWAAKKLILRGEDVVRDIQIPLKENENVKKKRSNKS